MTKKSKSNSEEMSRATKVIAFIGSIFGALLLWIYAIGYDSTLFERTFDGIEVVIQGEDMLAANKGFTLAGSQQFSSITVVAKGKRSELNELSSTDFRAVIDVSRAENAGEQTLNIIVYPPNGVEVVSQSSSTATVFVDEFTQRNELLSVKVDIGNNYIMTEGVTFVNAVSNPISVTVSGPNSVLDKIEGAYVNFNLDGQEIINNIYGYGEIELRDKDGDVIENSYVKISESTAYVSVTVTKQKVVPVRVAFVGGMYNPADVTVKASAQSVTVSGSAAALESISELVLEIDETAIDGKATFEFPIGAMLPDGVSNASGNSKITVDVTMPELSVRNYTIDKNSITVENLPEGAIANIKENLLVTVIGPRDSFNGMEKEDITVSVNFDRVTVNFDGSYTADAKITVSDKYTGVYVQSMSYKVNFDVVFSTENSGEASE